mmetsp:Transcript_14926/g.34660  ORF Transcript_14926/g.34660 Transcript_14926/m.34660 type:complete len:283 (+) Transcript_14926:1156-2004(+)
MDLALEVVPLEVNTDVFLALPIFCNFVVGLENVDEVLCVFLANILHSEVINDEGELDGSPLVEPEAVDDGALVVAVGLEAFLEQFLCEDAGLWKPVHSFADLDVDVSVNSLLVEVVFGDDLLGNVAEREFDVLEALHGSVEVEVGDVDGHELGPRRRHDAVQKDFEKEHVGGGRAHVPGVLDAISPEGEACPKGLGLLGTHGAHELAVGDFLKTILRYLMFVDEEAGVRGFLNTASNALEEPSELVGGRMLPVVLHRWMTEELPVFQHFPRVDVEYGVGGDA